jgi:hypothetical protein
MSWLCHRDEAAMQRLQNATGQRLGEGVVEREILELKKGSNI